MHAHSQKPIHLSIIILHSETMRGVMGGQQGARHLLTGVFNLSQQHSDLMPTRALYFGLISLPFQSYSCASYPKYKRVARSRSAIASRHRSKYICDNICSYPVHTIDCQDRKLYISKHFNSSLRQTQKQIRWRWKN